MKLKQIAASVALAAALGGAVTASQAASINVLAGESTIVDFFAGGAGPHTFNPFQGFDWQDTGNAVVTGFALPGVVGGVSAPFSLVFWARALSVNVAGPGLGPLNQAVSGHIGGLAGGVEYTTVASLTEVAVCTAVVAGLCTSANFVLVSGSFDIWYDATPDVNLTAGTGVTDGVNIISGFFTPGQAAGSFTAVSGTSGTGSNSLVGFVTSTDNTYINPDLIGTKVGTELKIGDNRTSGEDPDFLPGAGGLAGGATACGAGQLCFQADANQSFSDVPEPGSLALLGLGLLGLTGVVVRRRKSA